MGEVRLKVLGGRIVDDRMLLLIPDAGGWVIAVAQRTAEADDAWERAATVRLTEAEAAGLGELLTERTSYVRRQMTIDEGTP